MSSEGKDITMDQNECSHPDAHESHMELNGECPWCGAVGERDHSLDHLSDAEAVDVVHRRR